MGTGLVGHVSTEITNREEGAVDVAGTLNIQLAPCPVGQGWPNGSILKEADVFAGMHAQ